MIHALIVGPPHVGKTTLIDRVLQDLGRPVFGYRTKKEPAQHGLQPVVIYDARDSGRGLPVGYCRGGGFQTVPGAFDAFAPVLQEPVPENAILVFDEIGFMESGQTAFCDTVLSRLDGTIPVIAAVKDQTGFPLPDAVRAHPKCRLFFITEENRDRLAREVLTFLTDR